MNEISRRWRYGEKTRGRPRKSSISYENFLESIVLIAWKHNLDPKLLIEVFAEAYNNDTSNCGELKVTCRKVNQDSAIFLITRGEHVVSQFPISLEVLKNPEYFKAQVQYFPRSQRGQRKFDQRPQKIGDLRYGMKGIDLKAKVIKIPPALNVLTRFGTSAFVSNVTIADDTGSIRLSLWNEQINTVHVGDEVELKHCYIFRYRGEPQLRLGRKGILSVVEDKAADSLHKEK